MEMLDLEMSRTASNIIEHTTEISPSDEVLVLTDPTKVGVGRALANAANARDATTILSVMPLLDSHGNEPPESVAEAMVAADVCFTCTTHAITHTRSRLRAAEAGTHFVILRGVTEEMMIAGAMTADLPELRRVSEYFGQRITDASHGHVSSDVGTDVEFSLEGIQGFSIDGYYHPEMGFGTHPGGESPCHPKEDTTNGRIVVDVSMDNLGHVSEPLTMEVEDGFVVDVSGGDEATQLEAIFDAHDENARNVAEFAIGTNPKARLIGNLAEDKKRAGTVHFAVGDNESLGGTRQSDIHLDAVLRSPTVRLDDEVVVENGRLRTELVE